MKFTFPLLTLAAALAMAAPAFADNPETPTSQQVENATTATTAADATQPDPVAAPAPDAVPLATEEPVAAVEEERICRSIRVDMSSRRKSRVCLTEAGWRELNQQR